MQLWLLEKGKFFHITYQCINKFVKILGIKILVFDLDFGFTHQCISKIVSCCIAFYKIQHLSVIKINLVCHRYFFNSDIQNIFSFDERFLTIWNYFSRMMKIYQLNLCCAKIFWLKGYYWSILSQKISISFFHIMS